MNASRTQLTVVLAALTLVACSTDDESAVGIEVRDAEPVTRQRAGSLVVEFNPVQSNGVSVHAQFLDVQGVSLEAAFDALAAWSPDAALDDDACSIRVPPVSSDAEHVRLHMLDVGPISVAALAHSIELEGRRVPDLQSFSGVVYGNEEGFDFDEAFLPYEPLARYHISAPGGDGAGGFGVSLQAPAVPRIESLAGRYVVDDAPIELHGEDLALQWRGEQAAQTRLYLDVTSADLRIQCRLEDDGEFIVPASALEQFPAGQALQVTLRRVDALELPIEGVERTSFVFAATDEASIRR